MFCPKCGAQNKAEQKFCRSCGQSLSSVRMALEGSMDDAAGTLTRDLKKLASGAMALAIYATIAFFTNLFIGDRMITTLNLFLGLLIGGTIIYRGIKRLERSIKLLNPKEQAPAKIESAQTQPALAPPEQPVAALPAIPDTDPLLANPAPASVTEHTTFHLSRSE